MDLKDLNKPVNINDIDFRVQSVNKGGYATILAYKDARYDMNILDTIVGPENWQKDYKLIDERLYCGVGIYNKELNQWIWKGDVGTESNTEKEKGQASDSFKRACFNWGIGRELYDFPVIQVKLNADEFELKGDRCYVTWSFKLKEWIWNIERDENGKISDISRHDGKLRYTFGEFKK